MAWFWGWSRNGAHDFFEQTTFLVSARAIRLIAYVPIGMTSVRRALDAVRPRHLRPLVFWFFANFRPASGDLSLRFGGPFWGPWGRFYGLGARKTQKTKKLRKRSEVTLPVKALQLLQVGFAAVVTIHFKEELVVFAS